MANTVSTTGYATNISAMDSNFIWSTTFLGQTHLKLNSIEFIPGATDDVLIVRNGGTTGAIIFKVKCENDYDQRIKYFHGTRYCPCILYSECTLSPGHLVIVTRWPNS